MKLISYQICIYAPMFQISSILFEISCLLNLMHNMFILLLLLLRSGMKSVSLLLSYFCYLLELEISVLAAVHGSFAGIF